MGGRYQFVGIKLPPDLLRELRKHSRENMSETIRTLLREALAAREEKGIEPIEPLCDDFGSHR